MANTHTFTTTKEMSLDTLMEKQGCGIDIVKNPNTGKFFFACGRTADGKTFAGAIGAKALENIQKGDFTKDNYKVAFVSMDGAAAVPCLMVKSSSNVVGSFK